MADDKRSAEETARAEEQARTGTKHEPEPTVFNEAWKKVDTGSGEQRKVVGVELGSRIVRYVRYGRISGGGSPINPFIYLILA